MPNNNNLLKAILCETNVRLNGNFVVVFLQSKAF